jgi:hypothetical protein
MSWDIVLFNSTQEIRSVEEIDEALLVPINFCSVMENNFDQIEQDDNHRVIKGKDFSIEYFFDNMPVSNKTLSLYGEKAINEIVTLARKYNWQIFDTQFGQMIDLVNPSKNGYEHFQQYLSQIRRGEE